MDDLLLLDAVERYLTGNMGEQEKVLFEELRRNTPEVDQLVVEHKLFLHQIDEYAMHRTLKHTFNEVHSNLVEKGVIDTGAAPSTGAKVIRFFGRYKKTMGIAACIACVTALAISPVITFFTPKKNEVDELVRIVERQGRKINKIEQQQQAQNNSVAVTPALPKIPVDAQVSGGTGFMIDVKGYLVTNAHVLKGDNVVVKNRQGEFKAKIAFVDKAKDLAILKIEDNDFKAPKSLPYGFRKRSSDLGEDLFTLGYPRNEIVYNKGYLSAETGYNGDTSNCQLQLNANHGNSGGPVFSNSGEVIGVIRSRQFDDNDVVFAIRSKEIFEVVDQLKKTDTTYRSIKLPGTSVIKGHDRTEQVRQVEDFVYFVQSFNN
jgi:serine protease Do